MFIMPNALCYHGIICWLAFLSVGFWSCYGISLIPRPRGYYGICVNLHVGHSQSRPRPHLVHMLIPNMVCLGSGTKTRSFLTSSLPIPPSPFIVLLPSFPVCPSPSPPPLLLSLSSASPPLFLLPLPSFPSPPPCFFPPPPHFLLLPFSSPLLLPSSHFPPSPPHVTDTQTRFHARDHVQMLDLSQYDG